jgi:hypothetical protein
MTPEENYKISERSEDAIKTHGTIQKAIKFLKNELSEFENLWSKYSSDCLGHGITCNRLLIANLIKR